ncbi:MAG: hypothetical protein L3J61_02050 [Ghiorsea sp.]|nr:hypothetical protein [Ghiorsea sp.]
MLQANIKHLMLAAAIIIVSLSSCQTTAINGDITIEHRKNLEQQMPLHTSQPLHERSEQIPSSLLQAWTVADSGLNPIAETYKAYLPTPAEKELLKQSFNTLPPQWKNILNHKLTRIFFVENLIGAGITDWVINRETGEQFYTIMLNPRLFHTAAKTWLEYRANSMFSHGDYRITYANIPHVSALTYALLHETAHIIDFEKRITPVVDPLIDQYKPINLTPTPFTQNIWQDYTQPTQNYDFPYRNKLNAYQLSVKRGVIDNQKLPEIFASLTKRPFVSLYACLSWAEDYADFAAFHYLQTMVKALTLAIKKRKRDYCRYYTFKYFYQPKTVIKHPITLAQVVYR